ncbi:hypothetical protein F4212_00905 [Candidatus Poribacteria bacterium]|nr:hypothetical protein [Candidatus Poribacteria bacterium]
MEKLFSAAADIRKRLDGHEARQFVSDTFLRNLENIIFKAREGTYSTREDLWVHLLSYKEDLERIRWELARIPVAFMVVKHSRPVGAGGSEEQVIGLKTSDTETTFSLDAANCPDYVPDLETLSDGDTLWCLCSQQQARNLQRDTYPSWQETDSVIDWIVAFVDPVWLPPEMKAPVPIQTTQHHSIETPKCPDTQLTPSQRIYDYIQTHAPVSTDDILAQRYAGRSRTFAILKALQRNDKIEKVAHGMYQTP